MLSYTINNKTLHKKLVICSHLHQAIKTSKKFKFLIFLVVCVGSREKENVHASPCAYKISAVDGPKLDLLMILQFQLLMWQKMTENFKHFYGCACALFFFLVGRESQEKIGFSSIFFLNYQSFFLKKKF